MIGPCCREKSRSWHREGFQCLSDASSRCSRSLSQRELSGEIERETEREQQSGRERPRETKAEEFYSSKKLTIYAVANILNLPKETVRRKIERLKKKRLINHSSKSGLLPTSKSEEVMKPFAAKEIKSLSKFLQSLKKNKSLDEILNF